MSKVDWVKLKDLQEGAIGGGVQTLAASTSVVLVDAVRSSFPINGVPEEVVAQLGVIAQAATDLEDAMQDLAALMLRLDEVGEVEMTISHEEHQQPEPPPPMDLEDASHRPLHRKWDPKHPERG